MDIRFPNSNFVLKLFPEDILSRLFKWVMCFRLGPREFQMRSVTYVTTTTFICRGYIQDLELPWHKSLLRGDH